MSIGKTMGCLICFAFFSSIPINMNAAVDPAKEENAQKFLDEILREQSIKEQEKNIIIEKHLKAGLSYYKDGELVKAKEELKAALAIDPDNRQVKAELTRIEQNWNKDIEALYNQGLKFYRKKDIARAEEKWLKIPEESDYYKKAQDLLTQAKEVKKGAPAKEAKEEAAVQKAKKEPGLLEKGMRSFGAEDYQAAIDFFNAYLAQNPASQEARDGITLAEKRLEGQKEKKSLKEKMEDIKAAKELDILKRELQEKEMMKKVEEQYSPQKRGGITGVAEEDIEEQISGEEEKKKQALEQSVRAKMIKPMELEGDIKGVIGDLADATGFNLFLDPAALEDLGGRITSETPAETRRQAGPEGMLPPGAETPAPAVPSGRPGITVTFDIKQPMSLWDVLETVLPTAGLSFKVEPALIRISTPARLERLEKPVTKVYRLKYGVHKPREVKLRDFGEKRAR